jgi:hypothetical protein
MSEQERPDAGRQCGRTDLASSCAGRCPLIRWLARQHFP